MKKRKIFYLFPLVSILLTGCTFQEGWDSVKTWFNDKVLSIFNKNSGGSSKDGGSNPAPGDVTPEETKTHATEILYTDGYPNAPFYLKVGETKKLSVSLSPSKDVDPSEKLFKWELTGDNVTCDLTTDSNKIDITGAKAGTCTMKVTNTYNASLFKNYTIKVINYDETKDYLWQYSKSDLVEFGFVSKEVPNGTANGDANLGGMTWHYTRHDSDGNDLTTYLATAKDASGALQFGKSTDPETHLHFETENTREVSKITIEAGSSHSLAKMSIKVGGSIYMDEETLPYPSWSVVPTLPVVEGSSSGKIEIDIVTPDYVPPTEDDTTYVAPGGVYLKSILINFNDKLPDKTLTLVKDSSDFEQDSKYLIVGKYTDDNYYCLDGKRTSGAPGNPYLLEGFNFDDSNPISVPFSIEDYTFILSYDESGKLIFKSSFNIEKDEDGKCPQIGMNNSGGLSVTPSPANLGWSYSLLEDGRTDLYMLNSSSNKRHLGLGESSDAPKFDCYSDKNDTANIYFFKFN